MNTFLRFGLLALTIGLAAPARADVPPTQFQKQYAKIVYDFAVDGGAVGAHPSVVTLPAGIIPTALYVYVNTLFTSSGTSSVGFGCAGTNDLFAYHDMTAVGPDWVYGGVLNATAFNTGASLLNFNAPALHADTGRSVPSDCTVTTNVRSDSGFSAVTAGKFTAILEYFKK